MYHALLAYRPFLDPVALGNYWWLLLLPLSLGTAIVYKTLKLNDLRELPRQAAIMATQIVLFMVAAAVVVWIVVELV